MPDLLNNPLRWNEPPPLPPPLPQAPEPPQKPALARWQRVLAGGSALALVGILAVVFLRPGSGGAKPCCASPTPTVIPTVTATAPPSPVPTGTPIPTVTATPSPTPTPIIGTVTVPAGPVTVHCYWNSTPGGTDQTCITYGR